jgi:hypothetical protein
MPVKKRKTMKLAKLQEKAVAAVARGRPAGDREELFAAQAVGQPAEEERAEHCPGEIGRPAMPISVLVKRSDGLSFSAPETEPASVTSSPSRIQVTPSATTTSV